MIRRDDGQATVELALCLPVLALVVAAIVEIGLLSGDQVRVWHAAREAARVAAVDPDIADIREAAARSGLTSLVLEVRPEARSRVRGSPVTVAVEYARASRVPLVGSLLPARRLSARATMRIEQP